MISYIPNINQGQGLGLELHVTIPYNIYIIYINAIGVKTGVLHSPPPSIALSSVLTKLNKKCYTGITLNAPQIRTKMDVPIAWHPPAPM